LAGPDKYFFSTFDYANLDEEGRPMTIGYTWNIQLTNEEGQRLAGYEASDERPVGQDFIFPNTILALDYVVLCDGGDFGTFLLDQRTNRFGRLSYKMSIYGADLTDSILTIATENNPFEFQHILYFYDCAQPNNIQWIATYQDNDFYVSSIVRSGNILFEKVYNDQGAFVRLLDISDLRNITVLRRLDEGFPVPVCTLGNLIVCWILDEPNGLEFYDFSDIENPRLVASCRGARLSPYVLSDGSLAVYNSDENRVYVLDQIGLAVGNDNPYAPAKMELRAYPNPFNSTLYMKFGMGFKADTQLRIFDGSGRLQLERILAPNVNSTTWEAGGVSAGTYFVHLNTANGSLVQPVVLVK
jgi:hypothetical protein